MVKTKSSKYNWDVYFDETKSKKAEGRQFIMALLVLATVTGFIVGFLALIDWIQSTHGWMWISIPIGIITLIPITYYMWPDKIE